VGPAEHLNDTALLAIFVNLGLIDLSVLEDEGEWLKRDGVVVVAIADLDIEGEGSGLGATDVVSIKISQETFAVPVVLNGGHTLVGAASSGHGG